jgi:hypothetical protein
MLNEMELANSASWRTVETEIGYYPDAQWAAWKAMAYEFLSECFRRGLDHHFRAGQSMHHFVFSTLDRYGLRDEPRVTVELHPANHELRVAYGCSNLYFSPAELEYTLPFDVGLATFQRFLKQLWTATSTDTLPQGLNDLSDPILPFPEQRAEADEDDRR